MSRYTNDARWKRVRARKLAMTPNCERCTARGKSVPATDVHHKDGLGLAGPEGYDIANTESLCHSCHSSHTANARPKRRRPVERHPGLIDPPDATG